jgi:hypothetical protein
MSSLTALVFREAAALACDGGVGQDGGQAVRLMAGVAHIE